MTRSRITSRGPVAAGSPKDIVKEAPYGFDCEVRVRAARAGARAPAREDRAQGAAPAGTRAQALRARRDSGRAVGDAARRTTAGGDGHASTTTTTPAVLVVDEPPEREDREAITASAPSSTPPVSITTGAASAVANDPSERERAPAATGTVRGKRAPGVARRDREISEFLERRQETLTLARAEAGERIARSGEERAVCDALGALAHSQASPWSQHRERLSAAIADGRIPQIGAAARAACRDAAGDAARTSRRAPDPELALAVAVAYAVIARAPWATVRGPRAERSRAVARPPQRAFWR